VSGLFRKSIRTRLTLLYVSLLTAVLVLYGAGTSAFFLRNLREQVDETLSQDVETVETLLFLEPDGRIRVQAQDTDEDEGGRLLEVWSQDGPLLYRSPELRGRVLGEAPDGHEGIQGARLADGTRVRIVNRMHRIGTRPVVVRLAASEERLWQEFWEMVSVLSIGLPVAVALVGLTGYAVARRALRPLDSMARRAEQITAERLSERLNIENPGDELGHLGRVINETLARLERSFEQLRRFTADASHELRTPLTAIRSVGEVALQRSGDVNYYRDIVGSMLEEVNRLTRLVDSLLTMSRADAGRIPLQRSKILVLDLAKESAGLLEVLAEEKNQKLTVEGDPVVAVRGDRVILRQALVNLIDNAVKYSPSRGNIFVRVGSNDGDAVVDVQDSGPGISPEHRSKVFERFYRVDKARSREDGGTGLGLSIAEWAVGAHGGRIGLDSGTEPGCIFRIRLPRFTTEENTIPPEQSRKI